MNWSLLLFVVLGAAIMFMMDVVQSGKDFKPKETLPWYGLSVLVCGVLAYFINEPAVMKLLLVGAVIAFVHIFKSLKKIASPKSPE